MDTAALNVEDGAQEKPERHHSREIEDEEWSDELHKYAKQWLNLVIIYCTPCFLIFMHSIIWSIWYGSWWNTSGGQPYIVKPEDVLVNPEDKHGYLNAYYDIPQALSIHMYFAVIMLFLLIAHITCAYLGVVKRNGTAMGIHCKYTGPAATFVMFLCVALGIVSLTFCDINPKRGPQTLFFAWVGVGIITLGARGIQYANEGMSGLHMQYMAVATCLCFSPGWNRITTVGIRLYHEAMQADYTQPCFVASGWAARGYNYSLSFIIGAFVLFFFWQGPLTVAKAPMFKKWSFGFFYVILLGTFLMSCAFQLGYEWIGNASSPSQIPFFAGLDCSPERIESFRNWTNTMKVEGMFQPQLAYGMCASRDREQLQGLPYESTKIFRVDGKFNPRQYR